ncbi:MAG: hypothetical protein WKF92_12375 [Pyrinomonadaceae bacterium]
MSPSATKNLQISGGGVFGGGPPTSETGPSYFTRRGRSALKAENRKIGRQRRSRARRLTRR